MHAPSRILVVALVIGLMAGCDPFDTEFDDIEPAIPYEAQPLTGHTWDGDPLVVMTWNVKFGGGRIDFFFDCHGDRGLMTEGEVLDNLEGLRAKIASVDPDILFLQEVDVASKRSAYVDQVQWLLDHTSLDYGYYASQWKADFVPSDGLGKVDSGNAILSKYPLASGTRIALALRKDQSALTRYFYLRRNIMTATVDLGATEVTLVCTHLAAYDSDGTRNDQLLQLEELLQGLDADGTPFVAGGDFNTLPPGSLVTEGFPDEVCEDEAFQANPGSESAIGDFYEAFTPAIPLADYQADNAPYFTHTTDKDGFWNRKLDYLFTNGALHDGLVHQGVDAGGMATMPLSDHCPLTATWEVPDGSMD